MGRRPGLGADNWPGFGMFNAVVRNEPRSNQPPVSYTPTTYYGSFATLLKKARRRSTPSASAAPRKPCNSLCSKAIRLPPGRSRSLTSSRRGTWERTACYTLLARGAFLVSSSIRSGQVEFVEIVSQAGAECHLRNPFHGEGTLHRDGQKRDSLSGALLRFPTRTGESILVVASGTDPAALRRAIPGE